LFPGAHQKNLPIVFFGIFLDFLYLIMFCLILRDIEFDKVMAEGFLSLLGFLGIFIFLGFRNLRIHNCHIGQEYILV